MPMTSMEGVDEDLYGEGGESKPETDSVDGQEEQEATDLLSKSSFPGGCKVGDKYEIEITGDHGDQFSVKVAKPEEEETKPEPGSDTDLEKMNSEY